jgi:hypothetical protein
MLIVVSFRFGSNPFVLNALSLTFKIFPPLSMFYLETLNPVNHYLGNRDLLADNVLTVVKIPY